VTHPRAATAAPALSVVICTHNRHADLARCVASVLADAEVSRDVGIEVLIVDNASTPPVSLDLDRNDPEVRLVREPTVGLAHARNRGALEARGDLLVYLDDDATVRPGLLRAYAAIAADPSIGAAGGPIHVRWPAAGRPSWCADSLLAMCSHLDLGPEPQDLLVPEGPFGANLAVRRDVAVQHGFEAAMGRRGKALSSGEESDLLLRLARGGTRIRWVPDAAVDHHLQADRTTLRWILRRSAAQGRSAAHFASSLRVHPTPGDLVRSAVGDGWGPTLSPRARAPLAQRLATDASRRVRLLAEARGLRAALRETPAPRRQRPRVVATLVVRDAADTIDATVRYHAHLGIDELLVTDHRSTDGTRERLHELASTLPMRVFHRDGSDFDQARFVTRMARHAAFACDADWVLHLDADEFLCLDDGSLHDVLATVSPDHAVVELPVVDAVLRPDDGWLFFERMTVRTVEHVPGDPRYAPPKVLHRADPRASVAFGNHRVRFPGAAATHIPGLRLLHFPLRSKNQLLRKYTVGQAAVAPIAAAPGGQNLARHWRDGAQRIANDGLDDLYNEWLYDDERVATGLADGSLVIDTSVRDALRKLGLAPTP
jgi:glycosyltransferase involved in cell wall biosynthesis